MRQLAEPKRVTIKHNHLKTKIMDLKEQLFNKQVSDTVNCFSGKIKEIGEKHIEYCEENEIDFTKNIMLIYDIHNFKYSYIKEVSFEIKEEVSEAFKECLAKYSTNAK
jgi:hypothetical protein